MYVHGCIVKLLLIFDIYIFPLHTEQTESIGKELVVYN